MDPVALVARPGLTQVGFVEAEVVPPLAALGASLRTGCVSEPQSPQTFGVLVTRARPRRVTRTRIDHWWPHLAPSVALLHPRTSEDRDLGWEGFALRYRAELDSMGWAVRLRALLEVSRWLQEYPTVTLLSFEPARGREEAAVKSQRHVLRSWLLGT